MRYTEKIQITDLLQSFGLQFQECQWKLNICIVQYEKLKKCYHFINMHHTEKNQITDPSRVFVSNFQSVNRSRKLVLVIIKKLKGGCHFVNMHCMENFQITDRPEFASLVYPMSHLYICSFTVPDIDLIWDAKITNSH